MKENAKIVLLYLFCGASIEMIIYVACMYVCSETYVVLLNTWDCIFELLNSIYHGGQILTTHFLSTQGNKVQTWIPPLNIDRYTFSLFPS